MGIMRSPSFPERADGQSASSERAPSGSCFPQTDVHGKMILPPLGKDFFTSFGKQFFT